MKLAVRPTKAATSETGKESKDQMLLLAKKVEIEFTRDNPIPNPAKNIRPVFAECDWVKVISKPVTR